ncbi:hypothetical protein IVB33_08195, partial [Bradyrhizobium sp. 24]|nr:hypothetical protein [Bradyrhizobium sp. 24]
MPRKAKTKMRSVPQRAAQTLVTPFVGFGDVLALVDFETWKTGKRKRYRALLYAVFAALAACARVKPFTAATFLLADYEANRLEALNNVRDRRYPVVLLAAAVEVIEAYLKERRDLGIGGEHLLVDENGAPLVYSRIYLAFDQLSERCGHFGGKIVERLIEFHDLQLEKERKRRKPDLAACVALRHGRRGPLDKWQARAEIYAAAGDRARMLDVLDRNHDLGGASGKSVGGHGRAKALETGRLFSPPKLARRLTPGIRNDKVCARLLDFDWPKGKEAQVDERRNIVKADMPHLVWLLDEHKINRSDLRRILNCSMGTVRRHELV